MNSKSIRKHLERGDISHITTYQAGVLQASVNRILQKRLDTILKPYGISKMHWLIIGTVLDSGTKGVRLTDLAKQLDTTMAYITTAVNLLESKNMLERLENTLDNRSKLIVIAPWFRPRCDEIEVIMRKTLRETIYSTVTPDDFRVYIKVMYKLSKET